MVDVVEISPFLYIIFIVQQIHEQTQHFLLSSVNVLIYITYYLLPVFHANQAADDDQRLCIVIDNTIETFEHFIQEIQCTYILYWHWVTVLGKHFLHNVQITIWVDFRELTTVLSCHKTVNSSKYSNDVTKFKLIVL